MCIYLILNTVQQFTGPHHPFGIISLKCGEYPSKHLAGTGTQAQLKHLLDQVPILQTERMMATLLTTMVRLLIVFSQLRDNTVQCLQEQADASSEADHRNKPDAAVHDLTARPDDADASQQQSSTFSSPRTSRKHELLSTSQAAPSSPPKGNFSFMAESSRLFAGLCCFLDHEVIVFCFLQYAYIVEFSCPNVCLYCGIQLPLRLLIFSLHVVVV